MTNKPFEVKIVLVKAKKLCVDVTYVDVTYVRRYLQLFISIEYKRLNAIKYVCKLWSIFASFLRF